MAVRSSTPSEAFPAASGLRVILVDDDPFIADLMTALLHGLGVHDVHATSVGAAALALLDSPHDGHRLVFCDLQMPGMDGLELLRHLSRRPQCDGVVLVSGEDQRILASAKELASAQGLRVIGALTKPVSRQVLSHTLAKFQASVSTASHFVQRPHGFLPTADDLARGIAADELVVHYQPRVAVRQHRVSAVEGLVRWAHPQAGLLSPAVFVPLAEKSNLIDALTRSVFKRALRDLSAWHAAGRDIALSLNATVDTLARLEFADELCELADRAHAPLRYVTVEVTESRLAVHFEQVLETLTRLRLKRVGIAIDDFGTGYSTMEQLRRFPFTELKIDRAFVSSVNEDGTTRAILESSISLAHQLGMTTVAEGVETLAEFTVCRELGCDEVQGFLFAKAMPEAELLAWIAKQSEPPAIASQPQKLKA